MPSRNVVLTDHHERLIDGLVNSGRYENASEVLREGLRLIEQRDALEVSKLEALREAARIGFNDLDEDRYQDIAEGELGNFIAALGQKAGGRVANDDL